MVKVLFYQEFRRDTGVKEVELDVPVQPTVREVLVMVAERFKVLAPLIHETIAQGGWRGNLVVLDETGVATLDTRVRSGDTLRLVTPLRGG
jgi:molybdopterin converting factor small subunit